MPPKKPLKKIAGSKPTETGLSHSNFRQGGVISIFLGHFESEDELDTYLSEVFPVDYGFVIDPRDAPEMHVSPNMSFVDDLLDGFSCSKEFVEPVARALVKAGWHRSSAAVVFYNFRYNPKTYTLFNAFAKLKFMGTFEMEDKTWLPFRRKEKEG